MASNDKERVGDSAAGEAGSAKTAMFSGAASPDGAGLERFATDETVAPGMVRAANTTPPPIVEHPQGGTLAMGTGPAVPPIKPLAATSVTPVPAATGAGTMGMGSPAMNVGAHGPPPPAFGLAPGMVVAERYRVIKKLGEGGMGTVFLAQHMTIEKEVALKVLLHEYARKDDIKQRFLQEARASARINHPNVVDITDFGATPDGSVFFAMEFLDGADLGDVIEEEGSMAWTRARPILLQLCDALQAAHDKKIIHRDMKPENIYLVSRDRQADFVKVLDFGIAKVGGLGEEDKKLTRTGMIFGTPEYMSPEQAQGLKADIRADIYAVGVIMYEMLTGSVPFRSETFMGTLTKHMLEEPIPPSQRVHDGTIPPQVEAIILKAMTKNRDARFSSMTEMKLAIQADGLGVVVPTPTGRAAAMTAGTPAVHPLTTPPPDQAAAAGQPLRTGADLGLATSPYERQTRPGKRTAPLIAAIVAGLVACAAVAALFLRDTPTPPDREPIAGGTIAGPAVPNPAAKTPRATHVRLKIDSSPEQGALIYRDGAMIGKTPDFVSVPRSANDKIILVLKLAGFDDHRVVIIPDEDQTKVVQLAAAKPTAGAKVIKRRPPSRTTSRAPARTAKVRPRVVAPTPLAPSVVGITATEPAKTGIRTAPPRVEIVPKEKPKPEADPVDVAPGLRAPEAFKKGDE